MNPKYQVYAPNQNKSTDYLYSASGNKMLKNKIRKQEAVEISNFARRPVIWGDEVINPHFA